MERFFILDKFNTWFDWKLILTAKDIAPPEPKTNLVNIDGMSGSLDLSEALTGEITYNDRPVSATFWTSDGTYKDRESLLKKIRTSLHGKKVKIIEPDDLDHYFVGRVIIKDSKNILPYAEFKIEATCEPWRYSNHESVRTFETNSTTIKNVIINNQGVKTLTPDIEVVGAIDIIYDNNKISLVDGVYKITDIRLKQGVNMIGVSGNGSVTFKYKEADL